MSKVYAWQKYEDAKNAGLFNDHNYLWFYEKNMNKAEIIHKEDFQYLGTNTYVKTINIEPAPNLELLERNE